VLGCRGQCTSPSRSTIFGWDVVAPCARPYSALNTMAVGVRAAIRPGSVEQLANSTDLGS
jgi:hypothetical protein